LRTKCSNCSKIYNIADEKLPVGKKVAFPCPTCNSRIILDLKSSVAQKDVSPLLKNQEKENPEKPEIPSKRLGKNLRGLDLEKVILRSLGDLPAMPQVVLKIKEIIADPDSDFKDVERTIQTDQALVGKVLKLVNSAYYGQRERVSSLKRAAVILGNNALSELITVAGSLRLLNRSLNGYGIKSRGFWVHSLMVAYGAMFHITNREQHLANDAFISGLLHDLGKTILDPYISERKETFDKCIKEKKDDVVRAEIMTLGLNHAEIAAKVFKRWHFPKQIQNAVRYHHNFSKNRDNELANSIYVADSLAKRCSDDIESASTGMIDDTLNSLGIQKKQVESIIDEMIQATNQTVDFIEGTQ